MSQKKNPQGFSAEESRFIDGELPQADARRVEHRIAADPDLAERIDHYKGAMDLWRDDTSRAASKVRSTADTFGVGTRIAVPSNLPESSGSTSPKALAAPVDVGIIAMAAARAR